MIEALPKAKALLGDRGYDADWFILQRSGFAARFVAKGRFEGLMAKIPVKLIHPPPTRAPWCSGGLCRGPPRLSNRR